MSVRLVVLGLLRKQPLHGYELKHIIEDRMGDWTSIAFGSIYFALGKMEEEGFIEKIATEQEGGRPSRSIYQITEAGENEFIRLLRNVWQEVEREYYAIDIGVAFMEALSTEEVKDYLRDRITQLEEILAYVDEHEIEKLADEHVPGVAKAIFDHGRIHFEAELVWTRTMLEKVERGEYP